MNVHAEKTGSVFGKTAQEHTTTHGQSLQFNKLLKGQENHIILKAGIKESTVLFFLRITE
jgi:hypothetical protein